MVNRFFELEKVAKGAYKYIRDDLQKRKQIDTDGDGDPVVVDFKMLRDDLIRVYFNRGGKRENFTINPKGRKVKSVSFDEDDGVTALKKADRKFDQAKEKPKIKKPDGERQVRLADSEDYANFVRTLMRDSK